jgi:hypothetical protein
MGAECSAIGYAVSAIFSESWPGKPRVIVLPGELNAWVADLGPVGQPALAEVD